MIILAMCISELYLFCNLCTWALIGANYLGPVIMSMKYKENYISYSYYEYEQGVKLLGMKYKSYHLLLRPRSLLLAKTTTPKRVKKNTKSTQ